MHTIVLLLLRRGVAATAEGIAIVVEGLIPADVAAHLRDLAAAGPVDAFRLAASIENRRTQKHHGFLGEHLLSADYASSQLDPIGAHRAFAGIVANMTPSDNGQLTGFKQLKRTPWLSGAAERGGQLASLS